MNIQMKVTKEYFQMKPINQALFTFWFLIQIKMQNFEQICKSEKDLHL